MRLLYPQIRWLVAVVALMALPSMAEVRDTIDFEFRFLTLENITTGGETFVRYSLPDCDHIDQVGAPMLPVKYIRLSVPYNATNISIALYKSRPTTSPVANRVYPAPEPLTTNDTILDQPELVIDSAIYMTNAFWPAAPAELVGEGFYMGENRIVTVAVYPILYNPVTAIQQEYQHVHFGVTYSLGGTPANMLVRRGGDLRQQEQQAAKAIVDNPHQVEAFAVPAAQAQHMPAHGLIPDSLLTDTASYYYGGELYTWGDRARYLIVTTRELAPSFKRLAALKRQKGYSVQIKCIEDILADPRVQDGDVFVNSNGDTISTINDDAGKLRQYLKLAHAYDNTQFVLMGGKNVPFRYGFNDYIDNLGPFSIPSDWYFSDLTTNWNLDLDISYGEFAIFENSNGFDNKPELFVGRLMADNTTHINNYTDKLLRYELNPGKGDNTYLKRALMSEGFLNGQSQSISPKYASLFDELILAVQQNNEDHYPKGIFLIDSINSPGFGFVSILGHGNPFRICISGRNNPFTVYSRLTALQGYKLGDDEGSFDELNNKYSPFVFHTNACVTMPFDIYESYNGINLGQSFTLGKDYGGVGFIGNTRDGRRRHTTRLEKLFADQLIMGQTNLGVAYAMSNSLFSDIFTIMSLNVMGDPELDIWTNQPSSYDQVAVSRYENSICVSGILPQEGVYVALCPNGSMPIMRKVLSGDATFNNVNPNSTVMVYSHNYLPHIVPLYLQNERIVNSQYVIANDVIAGRNVDSNRTAGDLTIASGVDFEIDAKGSVILAPGFTVEKGALFSVTRSDY